MTLPICHYLQRLISIKILIWAFIDETEDNLVKEEIIAVNNGYKQNGNGEGNDRDGDRHEL